MGNTFSEGLQNKRNIAEGDANKLNSVVLDINFMSLYAYWYSPPQHYQVLMWSLKKSNLPTIPLKLCNTIE